MVNTLAKWLQTFPGFHDAAVQPGCLQQQTGSLGLYSGGVQVLQVKEDVLGNRQEHCRHSLILRFNAPAFAEDGFNTIVELQHWVQAQNALGLAPHFGDVPEKSVLRAQNGRLERTDGSHAATYAVELSADYMKLYEVK